MQYHDTPVQAPRVDQAISLKYFKKQDPRSWHSTLCETFSQTDYMCGPETQFRGELTYASHGFARIARIHSSPGWFGRDQRKIRRDSFDGFQILLSLQGDVRLQQDDRHLQAQFGEALIYRHGVPFEVSFPENYRALSLWVEPDFMERHCAPIARQAPMVIRSDTANGRLALTMVRELCVGTISQRMMNLPRLVGSTLDVVSTILAPEELNGQGLRNRWLIEKLAKFVRDHIDDTKLDLNTLVDAAGVSARTLNRAFAQQGTTPMRWVWDQRLDLACDALKYARVRNVTEAAFAYGFKDGSHFSRAFSKKFGRTPNSVLRSHS